ncbi:Mitochondrial proton/calcium exchanger protein [Heracleum sosnowskyi]|uniref:Mitochondrial proton/calcium exchanger protein n=1 Tax=Heracleum sosnowskyi TaxID=360622 RepID=A0AAD8HIX8_9APIA|nr:Mitochondrial proton/calcium exchanger protein [Heracleum sosnowskyi]
MAGALLLLRRKCIIFYNLGQGQVSTSTLIHGVAKGLFRRHCCCYSSGSSQSTRHASTYTSDQPNLDEKYNYHPAFDDGFSSQEAKDSAAFTIMRRLREFILGAGASFGAVAFMCRKPWATESYGWKHAYLTVLAQYELGIQLLTADVRISWRFLLKLICQGKSLSRRERQLLVQTTTDLFITVPASKYVVLQSMELMLPVLPDLLFPVLPDLKAKRKLNAKREVFKFLSDLAKNLVKIDGNSQRGDIQPSAEEYFEFVTRVSRCRPVKVEQLLGFAELFTDELILNNVSRHWLVIMCKYMGIPPLGTDEFLRFVLQERLECIKNEDKVIQAKGVDSLSEAELCKVCRERGIQVAEEMRHVAEEMRQQLRTWLGLSLRQSLSSSFLIISRALTVVGNPNINPLEPALATIYSFSYEFKLIVGIASFQSNDPIKDKTRKLHCLELLEKRIEEEEKKELSEMKQSDAIKEDVALQEMTISMREQARARSMDQQEQPFKLINNAITVLSSALNVCTECEKISRIVNEEPVALPLNLEKEFDDMISKTGGRWQVLDRYCDGKVSQDVVIAATFLKDTLDKDAIQEHLSILLKYKDEIVKLGFGAEDVNRVRTSPIPSSSLSPSTDN